MGAVSEAFDAAEAALAAAGAATTPQDEAWTLTDLDAFADQLENDGFPKTGNLLRKRLTAIKTERDHLLRIVDAATVAVVNRRAQDLNVLEAILHERPIATPRPEPASAQPDTPGLEKVIIDLKGCARCTGDGHPGLEFTRLTWPIRQGSLTGDATHWAACPTTGEPILLGFVPKPSTRP